MSIVEVNNLRKVYPSFQLQDVSFSIRQGRITGFIGRNGAGKTTTIKSILNLVHPEIGEVSFFGIPLEGHEAEIKKRIGYSTGTVSWYPRKKIRDIVSIVSKFYETWDDEAYRKYLRMFELDENKTPLELSEGMKVKLNLLIALSHRAEVLILDEPTSGLDPFSRDELLRIFTELKEHGVAVFFSTHITSDLDKSADNILYIVNGSIRADAKLEDFIAGYRLAEYTEADLADSDRELLIGRRRTRDGFTSLVRTGDAARCTLPTREVNLEEIMVHMEKEGMK